MNDNGDQKFLQRWQFRSKDDEVNSSSDDSKSNSSDEPLKRRHKLVSNLMSPETDHEGGYNQRSQEESQPCTDPMDNYDLAEASGKANESLPKSKSAKDIKSRKKIQAAKHKVTRGPAKEKKTRNRIHCSIQEPSLLDDFKIFTESLVAEIRTARENMFAEMRKELNKLAGIRSRKRPARKKESIVNKDDVSLPLLTMKSGRKSQNCHGVMVRRSKKSNSALTPRTCSKAVEHRVISDQALAVMSPKGMDSGERSTSALQKKPVESTEDFDHQIATSSHLTLPTVMSSQFFQQISDIYLKNHILPGTVANSSVSSLDRMNSLIGANNHHGYLSSIQQEQHLGYSFPFSSKSTGFYDRQSTQTSAVGSGFSVPLPHGANSSFNMPGQLVLENISQDNNRIGLRMNDGAVRFNQGSHVIAERLVANCMSSHMNYKPDGGVFPVKSEELSKGSFHSS